MGGADGITFAEHLGAENKEEDGGEEVGDAFGDQGWDSVAEHGRENGHGDERGKGSGEHEEAGMFHGHKGGDQKCLIANLREDNHSQGEEEGVKRLNQRTGCGR